jgi:GAF domain-containing protein
MPFVLDPYHITLISVALITGVISPLVIQLTRHYLSQSKNARKRCEVSRNLKREALITSKLEKILYHYNVDRVWVLEFHNGGYTFTGKSMQKFSETYEAVQIGISREGYNTQNLPTSLFSKFFKIIADKNFLYVKNTNEHDRAGEIDYAIASLQSFFESRGIKSFISIGINNIENNLIGVLCLDSVKEVFNLNEDIITNLKTDASTIAGYLENIKNIND